jgi:hypothetical protein
MEVNLLNRLVNTWLQVMVHGSRPTYGFRGPNARTLVASTDSVDRRPELSLRSRIPWTEGQNSFRGPKAKTLVASTDSVWTEGQNSRCVHGFRGPKAKTLVIRGPNTRTLVASTNYVDRRPELSLRSLVHGFRGPNARSIVAFTDLGSRIPTQYEKSLWFHTEGL